MIEFFHNLFGTDFMPHVMCLRTPGVIWLHVVSDVLIAVAYLIIPLGLLQLLRIRKDISFHWMFILFAGFILTCGATHVLAVVTLWTPVYRFEGLVKAATAVLSIATAYCLTRLIPKIAQLPSLDQWRQANEELKMESVENLKSQQTTALMAAIVANSEDAIISLTLQGVITSWNRGAERLFGHSSEEVIGHDIGVIIPPELSQEEANLLSVLSKSESVNHFETERLHRDGRRIRVSLSASPLLDASGGVVGASKILRNIGHQKRAEEQFRLVVESAPNAMVMINREGEITLVNELTEQWFGYSREEMMGKRVEMLLPERFRHAHPGHRPGFFNKPAVVGPRQRAMGLDRELYGRRKDGTEFPIEVGLNPIQTENGPMVLSAIVDVTARKRMEDNIREFNRILEKQVDERTTQLRSANQELEEFAFVASHDLKAPLRVIDNCSKWIEEDLQEHLSGDTRENMSMLRGRVQRMDKLLDDLLEYARIGRVTDARYTETISAEMLMNNVLELLAPRGFAVTAGPNFADVWVTAMPLQQILMNLIGNAIKHHDKKTGSIEVTLEDRGTLYAFAVKDDGPGIPAEFHEQVFKMFQTLRPRDQVEGSGMGLAMVRKHVELAGGTMELESAEGKGSTFRFTWPKQQQRLEGEATEDYANAGQTT